MKLTVLVSQLYCDFINVSRKIQRDFGGVRKSSCSSSEVGCQFISYSLSYLFKISSFNDFAVALI